MKFAYFACRLRHLSVTGSSLGLEWFSSRLIVEVWLLFWFDFFSEVSDN